MTHGGRAYDGGRVRVTAVRVPLSRDGRFAKRPYGAVGELGIQRGWWWGCPARLDTGFRRYDA